MSKPRSNQPVPQPLQEKAERMLARVFGGRHHVSGYLECGHYVSCRIPGGAATFDFDLLTRLVLGAHEYCLRIELVQGGPHYLKLLVHDRQREGSITERHPDIQEAIARWEKSA